MFTACLAEITKIEKRVLSVQPYGKMSGIVPPEIHDVPLGMLGNEQNHTDHNLKIGDVIVILFLTFNPGNYVSFGGKDTLPDFSMNDYNNAVALPIVFNRGVFNLDFPEGISHIGNIIHSGNTNRDGSLTQNGNASVTGNVEATEKIEAPIVNGKEDVTFGGVSGKGHTHNYNPGPGAPTATTKPQ